MEIRREQVQRLRPAAYNPRKKLRPSDLAYQEIKRSLETFGLVQPLVWNEATGNLVAGHQRLQVLIDMGYAHVPVAVVNIEDLNTEKALNLALNKLSGEWDTTLLADVLEDLVSNPDFDLPTGFSESEIDDLLASRPDDTPPTQQEAAGGARVTGEYEGQPEGVSEGRGLGNPVIKYEIIFDDEVQQAAWFAFVKWLKVAYESDTLGARLAQFVTDMRAGDYGVKIGGEE